VTAARSRSTSGGVKVAGLAHPLDARTVISIEIAADVPVDHLPLDRVAEKPRDDVDGARHGRGGIAGVEPLDQPPQVGDPELV
jgi:hypothetical protein